MPAPRSEHTPADSHARPPSAVAATPPPPPSAPLPSFPEALRTFAFIGLNSFGGPAGQISVMHRVLVEEKRWISEERFLHALNYCMLLPGPEAMQLVTYVGWLLHKTRGGLAAGLLFVLPGFVSILALSIAYTSLQGVGVVEGLLFGLKAAVLAIVAEAVIRIGKRVLKNAIMLALAAASFVAIFVYQIPFPLIVVAAALIGLIGGRLHPALFAVLKAKAASEPLTTAPARGYLTDHLESDHTRPTLGRALGVLAVWLPLWLLPVIALRLILGPQNVYTQEAIYFSKAAVVTFGGAYAVLAYVAQQAVDVYHWLQPGEMLTGLGMAETTPGPLIMVLQFVGYMGAYRDAAGNSGAAHAISPVLAGVLASVLVAWVTFAPCFLWIFLGAPYVERLRQRPALNAALSCVTAAVVGVILNLSVWLAIHTLFRTVSPRPFLGGQIPLPTGPAGETGFGPAFASLDIASLIIAVIAALALVWRRWSILKTLALATALGVLWFLTRAGR